MTNQAPEAPLKIRGAGPARRTNSLAGGGVMKNVEITPLIPLTLRGRWSTWDSFGIQAFCFCLQFGF